MLDILNEPFIRAIRALIAKFAPDCPEVEANRYNRKLHTDLAYYLIQLASYEAENKIKFIELKNEILNSQSKPNISKAISEAENSEHYARYRMAKGLWKSIVELINALKKEVAQNELESKIN
jgi:hypothetical protein